MVYIDQTITSEFIVYHLSTGASTPADSLPTGILRRNGSVVAPASVTVTSLGVGKYSVTTTFTRSHGWVDGDSYSLEMGWQINSIQQFRIVSQGPVEEELNDVLYHADINLTLDTSQDEYTVIWFKDGVRVSTGVTNPTLEVINRANGSQLISTIMDQIGSTCIFKYDETENKISKGQAVIVIVQSTIDSETRTFSRVISRDK